VKRFFVLLCVLVLVAGFAVADDIGVDVGVEFYNGNINKADGDPTDSQIAPFITYENTFGGALTFHAGLENYYIHLEREPGPDGDYFPQDFDLNIWLNYRLNLSSASNLQFYLQNQNNVEVEPVHHGTTYQTNTGTLTPGVRFGQNTDFGGFYVRFRAPYDYVRAGRDDTRFRLRSRLGWTSNFGLGLWAQVNSQITPELDLYQALLLYASYGTDSFGDFDVTVTIPKEVSSGITINPTWGYDLENSSISLDCTFSGVGTDDGISLDVSPYVEYRAGAWTLYTQFDFTNVTANGGDMSISPTLGVKFSF